MLTEEEIERERVVHFRLGGLCEARWPEIAEMARVLFEEWKGTETKRYQFYLNQKPGESEGGWGFRLGYTLSVKDLQKSASRADYLKGKLQLLRDIWLDVVMTDRRIPIEERLDLVLRGKWRTSLTPAPMVDDGA